MYSRNMVELEDRIRRQENHLGDDHPQLLEGLSQLSHLYFVFGRYDDVERLLWRAVTICSKWFGHEHVSLSCLLVDLGYLYEAQERWAEAEHVYRLSYAIKATNFGVTDQESMKVARSVVRVCRAQNKRLPERELEKLAHTAVH